MANQERKKTPKKQLENGELIKAIRERIGESKPRYPSHGHKQEPTIFQWLDPKTPTELQVTRKWLHEYISCADDMRIKQLAVDLFGLPQQTLEKDALDYHIMRDEDKFKELKDLVKEARHDFTDEIKRIELAFENRLKWFQRTLIGVGISVTVALGLSEGPEIIEMVFKWFNLWPF